MENTDSSNLDTTDTLTQKCLEMISNNCAKINLELLANKLNYHPSYISRHIKRVTGKTVTQLITYQKLRNSQDLLIRSNKPVSEISELVGYFSESHFFRIFKEYYQIIPNHYRKLMKL